VVRGCAMVRARQHGGVVAPRRHERAHAARGTTLARAQRRPRISQRRTSPGGSMSHPVRRLARRAVLGVALLAASLSTATRADAHGSLEFPPSRTYACRFLEPDNPMCRQAWDANPQALYDWMEVNIG